MKLNELIEIVNLRSKNEALKDLSITALTRGYEEGFYEGTLNGLDKADEAIRKNFINSERNKNIDSPTIQGVINDFSGKVGG